MSRASLPMYDLPELRQATDAGWTGLARAFAAEGLDEVPSNVERDIDLSEEWRDPGLLFSQTCGYPLTHAFAGIVQPVATPVYAAAGCAGPKYSSAIIVRADDPAQALADLRGRTAGINYSTSQSGYNVLRHMVAPLAVDGRFFGAVVETGGHPGSIAAVADGRADVAAVDCVTYALFQRAQPDAVAGLRVLTYSPQVPALPYVTSAGADADRLCRLQAGVQRALADPDLADTRAALLIDGAEPLPVDAYQPILDMEAEALALGYPRVA